MAGFICRHGSNKHAEDNLAAAMGGLDAIVFTGGIGEHAAPIRERVCRKAAWLGIELDATANAKSGPRISSGTPSSSSMLRMRVEAAPSARCVRVAPWVMLPASTT